MKIIIFLCLLLYTSNLLAQNNESNEVYLQKYKVAKKKGNRLAIIGGSSIVLGAALLTLPTNKTNAQVISISTGYTLIGAGIVIGSLSIPIYNTARNNKRKVFRIEPLVTAETAYKQAYSSIGIKVKF